MNSPLKAGVTGGIGSGKSIVCRIFSILGIPVYDADSRAKALMTTDHELMEAVRSLFGDQAYLNGNLNRSYIASHTFNDSDKLEKLNKLVHPAVGRDFEKWHGEQNSPYVIEEAALLIETGSYRNLDFLINVEAPVEVRIDRVLKRDTHRDEQQVKDIMQRQMTDEARREIADLNILNDNKHMIIPRVLEADKLIRGLRN